MIAVRVAVAAVFAVLSLSACTPMHEDMGRFDVECQCFLEEDELPR